MIASASTRGRSRQWIAALLVAVTTVASVAAAELTEPTTVAYTRYLDTARQTFLATLDRSPTTNPVDVAALKATQTLVTPGGEDGIISVRGGLIHHWRARILIAGVSLDDVVAVSRSYRDYPEVFGPIVAATVLSDQGENLEVQFRMKESAAGMSATLDMRSRIRYVRASPTRVYSISTSEEITEVKSVGSPDEHRLQPGRDSGYLWRAASLTRFVQDDGGVYMDMETVGLSRQFPPLLGWFIEPIARRLGRRSVESSVNEFRRAVLMRTGRRP
jgi:hypothetical protein